MMVVSDRILTEAYKYHILNVVIQQTFHSFL